MIRITIRSWFFFDFKTINKLDLRYVRFIGTTSLKFVLV